MSGLPVRPSCQLLSQFGKLSGGNLRIEVCFFSRSAMLLFPLSLALRRLLLQVNLQYTSSSPTVQGSPHITPQGGALSVVRKSANQGFEPKIKSSGEGLILSHGVELFVEGCFQVGEYLKKFSAGFARGKKKDVSRGNQTQTATWRG